MTRFQEILLLLALTGVALAHQPFPKKFSSDFLPKERPSPPFSAVKQPLAASVKDENECVLIIPRDSKEVCITRGSVNRAFSLAARDLTLSVPDFASKDDDTREMATILIETSQILAEEYKLSADEIHAGLPLINLEQTLIQRTCPATFLPRCTADRFRTYNGQCNNLENPNWGATEAPFRRLLPPDFADGVGLPRISVTGEQLPTARFISTQIHRDLAFHDHAVTVYLPTWGQLIDHDFAAGALTIDPRTNAEPVCCNVAPARRHPACWPIDIPSDDPFYSLFGQRCLEFVRGATTLPEDCKLGPKIGFNSVTHFLDASFVYGSNEEVALSLRTFRGGLLLSNPVLRELGYKDLLPPQIVDPDVDCRRPSRDLFCFVAGDFRVNQQAMLTTMQILFMREHNRLATELAEINPHWGDERLYQEARRIVGAFVQHITYNEYLPMVLGKKFMNEYGLLLEKSGLSNRYDSKMNPNLPLSFFAAAYRFGHSLLPSKIEQWSVSHKPVVSRRLSELFMQPFELYKAGVVDRYMVGMMNQVSQAVDEALTGELTNHLFAEPLKSFGADLASLNMQRGRDHGVPSYNAFREFCGLKRARSWKDLAGSFTNQTLQKYAQIYASPDDIDLWSAGISERPSPGSMVGPVFGCLIGEGFKSIRYADRFWYENGNLPNSFTVEQVNEIRRVKLSRLICDNGDRIESAQVYVMVLPDPQINPRVPCKSSVLPRLNLEMWRESPKGSSFRSSESESQYLSRPSSNKNKGRLAESEKPYPHSIFGEKSL